MHYVNVFLLVPLFISFIGFCGVACPTLAKVPRVMVVHGEGDGTLEQMKVYF